MKRKYYPLFMDMRMRPCLVVGGGKVAERKVKSLVGAGARVTVLSPEVSPEILKLHKKNKILWKKKMFSKGDAKGPAFVFCATNNKTINHAIYNDAEKHRAFANVADDPSLCHFIVPASFQKGAISVAVSTEGKSPAFSAALKRKLQKDIPDEYAKLLEIVHKRRHEIKKSFPDESRRTEFVSRLIQDNKILHFISKGNLKSAQNYLKKKIR